MLSGIVNLFSWGTSEENVESAAETQASQDTAENVRLKVREAEDEWELVDKSSRATSPDRHCSRLGEMRALMGGTSDSDSDGDLPGRLNESAPDPETVALLRVLPGCTTVGESDPSSECETVCSELSSIPENVVYPSLEESWFVTPPPCFITGGNSPHRMDTHPLENLLIEHPSMSVYHLRGRQHSVGLDSEHSESSNDADHQAAEGQQQTAARHVALPPHRPRAVAARAGLTTRAMAIRSMQAAKKRQESRFFSKAHMERSNKLRENQSKGRHVRKHCYHLRHSGRSNDRKMCY